MTAIVHKTFSLADLTTVEQFAKKFAAGLSTIMTSQEPCQQIRDNGFILFLVGDLGVGKTTFVRYVLNHLGYQERIKSPTYTIVESYQLPNMTYTAHHFDLYRINHPEECYYLGIEEYFTPKSLVFIEWPNHGDTVLPEPDMVFNYQHAQTIDEPRVLNITAKSPAAKQLIELL